MRNYHETSLIMPRPEREHFGAALRRSYRKDTAYPPDQEFWTPDNPTVGHCVVVTLLGQEFFGGQMIYLDMDHSWNIFPDGTVQDFTRDQYPNIVSVRGSESIVSRSELLFSEGAIKARTLERYNTFGRRVTAALSEIDHRRYRWNDLIAPAGTLLRTR